MWRLAAPGAVSVRLQLIFGGLDPLRGSVGSVGPERVPDEGVLGPLLCENFCRYLTSLSTINVYCLKTDLRSRNLTF